MPEKSKGILNLYDETCELLTDNKEMFFEWILNKKNNELIQGQLCTSIVWYEKKDKWYLEEVEYDPYQEKNSTWKAIKLLGTELPYPNRYVMKFFELEKDESLITVNSKNRPVILIQKYDSDWQNPLNSRYHVKSWLCLPLFSYRNRHNQEYVLRDQCLEVPNRFYIPRFYDNRPGTEKESAARFYALQMINEKYLKPIKMMCCKNNLNMRKPFKISNIGLKIIMYHLFKNIGIFEELVDVKSQYDYFKEYVTEYIQKANE